MPSMHPTLLQALKSFITLLYFGLFYKTIYMTHLCYPLYTILSFKQLPSGSNQSYRRTRFLTKVLKLTPALLHSSACFLFWCFNTSGVCGMVNWGIRIRRGGDPIGIGWALKCGKLAWASSCSFTAFSCFAL